MFNFWLSCHAACGHRPPVAQGGIQILGIVSSRFDCAPSLGTGNTSAMRGSGSATHCPGSNGAYIQNSDSSSTNIIIGLRNVVWPPDVVNLSSGCTFRPDELFPNPQSSRTDRISAAAVTTRRSQLPRRVPTEPVPWSVRQVRQVLHGEPRIGRLTRGTPCSHTLPQWHSPQSTMCTRVLAGKRPPEDTRWRHSVGAAPRGKSSPAAQRTGGHRDWFQEDDGRLGHPKRSRRPSEMATGATFPARAPRSHGQRSPRKVTPAAWSTRTLRLLRKPSYCRRWNRGEKSAEISVASTVGAAVSRARKLSGHWEGARNCCQKTCPNTSPVCFCSETTIMYRLLGTFAGPLSQARSGKYPARPPKYLRRLPPGTPPHLQEAGTLRATQHNVFGFAARFFFWFVMHTT